MRYQEQFLEVISDYLDGRLRSSGFCDEFIRYWTAARDEETAQREPEKAQRGQELLAEVLAGTMPKEEFGQEWTALWGYSDDIRLHDLVDAVHSACMCYTTDPEMEWEIDGTQLRKEVADLLASYNAWCNTRRT